jgi:hypothetical protein
MRAHSDEINIQTLISSTKFAQTIASKVFKVYPPALFVRRVGCKVMLCAGGAFADCCDVLPDVSGQIIDMMGVVWIFVDYGAASRGGRELARKQNTGG